MAAEKADNSVVTPDHFPGTPHPAAQTILIGHETAEKDFLEAVRQKRLHHAWLIGGLEGIGKATLAYRIARFILHHRPENAVSAETLDIPKESETFRQIEAFSHPNLWVLRRHMTSEGKISAVINVDSVRKALGLFTATSVAGRHRICIIDSADDLNNSSANALLKLIEEPPPNSLFLIISHAPQRLLPTIRSRCRKLILRPLSDEQIRNTIPHLGEKWQQTFMQNSEAALGMGEGSVRQTLKMLSDSNLDYIKRIEAILSRLPSKDDRVILSLAESFTQKDAEDRLSLFLDFVQNWISAFIKQKLDQQKQLENSTIPPSNFIPVINSVDQLIFNIQQSEIYNLDRRSLIIRFFDDLAKAMKNIF